MIVITTIDSLPDHCHECPCQNVETGRCQADKERRYSDYRPYWCPLKERDDPIEPIEPTLNENHSYISDAFKCGKCGHAIRFHVKYCEDCGQAVKWTY